MLKFFFVPPSYCPRLAPAAPAGDVVDGDDEEAKPPPPAAQAGCTHTKVDWVMWAYRHQLISRVKAAVRRLNAEFYPSNDRIQR